MYTNCTFRMYVIVEYVGVYICIYSYRRMYVHSYGVEGDVQR